MRIADIVNEVLKEQRDSSEDIIQQNEITYEDMSIEQHEPGAFGSRELTDGESVNTNIEDIPTKQEVEAQEHSSEEECGCDDPNCPCHQKEESLVEATMNDLPHEIDEPIHALKDIRFDLEQTEKNWDLAGIETEPLDDILANIDDLVAKIYKNGAKLADEQLDAASEESEEKAEEPAEEEKSEEEVEEKKESAIQSMIVKVLTESLSE